MYNCKHLYNIFISASCEHLNVTEANSLGEECGDWRVAERVRIGGWYLYLDGRNRPGWERKLLLTIGDRKDRRYAKIQSKMFKTTKQSDNDNLMSTT